MTLYSVCESLLTTSLAIYDRILWLVTMRYVPVIVIEVAIGPAVSSYSVNSSTVR